jgi:ParB-like chromosome segregation protein Spo0J
MGNLIVSALVKQLAQEIAALPLAERIEALNDARSALHAISPFADEPVDCVLWVPSDSVLANDYNPNQVAPPEMRLLETSIMADGYTQPIVTHTSDEGRVTVDGFHRTRIGKECPLVRKRVLNHLPVVQIRAAQGDKESRMASTIRHNRARGKHAVDPMTDLVSYLAKKGWDDAKVSKELGMDLDEVLRFRQISGLAELFADREFSEAWEIDEEQMEV